MKKQPKWEVNFQDRIKQRDIAKGIRPPDPEQKGFRHKQYKKYIVTPPLDSQKAVMNQPDWLRKYDWSLRMYKVLWLKHHEVVERKLMGYTVELYDDEKHWYMR